MGCLVGAGGDGFEQSRPLRAVGVADVDYVQLALAVERVHDRAVARHVAERGPRADFLEFQHRLPRRFEGTSFFRSREEGLVSSLAGIRHAAEQSVEEVRGELLVGVAVRRAHLVEHPHELLHAAAVSVGDGLGRREEDVISPVGVVGGAELDGDVARGGNRVVVVVVVGGLGGGGGAVGGGGGGGGGGGRGVVVIGRRGEIVIIHENVEAFFFEVVLVVRVLAGGARAA